MYKIEKRDSGYLLFFSEKISKEEMQNWYDESMAYLETEPSDNFSVVVDMRDLKPLSPDAQKIMIAGQELYKKSGMGRSSVIVNSSSTVGQFQAIAKKSGIFKTERYFDGNDEDATHNALRWAQDGVEPNS